MYMRIFGNIALTLVVALVATVVVSCSNETDTTLTSQQTSIANYLKNSHSPRLIEESALGDSLDDEPHFYVQWGVDLYRYIATYYEEGRDLMPEVAWGDSLEIKYAAYIFSGSNPRNYAPYATNDAELIAELEAAGLNTSYEWTTDPYTIQLGHTELIEGLETALPGCRKGDKVEIYMTFEQAYGNDYIGLVPNKSAVAWFIEILDVTKQG